jgi:hypothetical protein
VTAYESAGLTRKLMSCDSGGGAGAAEAADEISTRSATIRGPNQLGTVDRVGDA